MIAVVTAPRVTSSEMRIIMRPHLPLTLAFTILLGIPPANSARVPTPANGPGAATLADSIRYSIGVHTGSLVGVTITNYGFLGNNFNSRSPSVEYPMGSGYEHLVRGGLWVGAQAVDSAGAFTGVTTACLEAAQGSGSTGATEFTPAGMEIRKRSTLTNSSDYDPQAISELDFIGSFSDLPARSFTPENHRPLNLLVRHEVYGWSFGGLEHSVFLRYVIRNQGSAPLTNLWAGLFTEFASGSRADYSNWPPSSSSSPTGGWYSKKWIQYDESLRLFREHYCFNQPVPGGCNLGHVPVWVGVKLLGVSPGSLADADKHVTLAAWDYAPGSTLRDQDAERYAIMSAGTIQDLSAADLQPFSGDPVELLAAGPFASIAPGDSVIVAFALVGGAEIADLQEHASLAQQFYDSGFDIAVPVEASFVSADAEPGLVRLRWYTTQAADGRWTVARTGADAVWRPLGEATADGTNYLGFEDRSVAAGQRYGYRIETPDGAAFGETWVDVPGAAGFALLGIRPQPAGPGDLRIAFSLAEAGPVRLELFDAGGRCVRSQDLGTIEAGTQLVSLERGTRVGAGIYFARLTQGGRSASMRVVVLD
jgi:hypothetical protein